jgi:hypothetical protein
VLRPFAVAADAEADGAKPTRWSYRRDFGRVRLLMIDSRCGRILAAGQRAMLSDPEFSWVEEQAAVDGYDHLIVGTSLPWLLPRAVHDIESWDEALCAGSRGPRLARLGERLREGADMEHWAAFRRSFDRLTALLAGIGAGAERPASICVLSGDVHHAYAARARLPADVVSPVWQLVVSPVHHTVPISQRTLFRVGWSKPFELLVRGLARLARVPPLELTWTKEAGPFFGNVLGTLVLDGRAAHFTLGTAEPAADRTEQIRTVLDLPLT